MPHTRGSAFMLPGSPVLSTTLTELWGLAEEDVGFLLDVFPSQSSHDGADSHMDHDNHDHITHNTTKPLNTNTNPKVEPKPKPDPLPDPADPDPEDDDNYTPHNPNNPDYNPNHSRPEEDDSDDDNEPLYIINDWFTPLACQRRQDLQHWREQVAREAGPPRVDDPDGRGYMDIETGIGSEIDRWILALPSASSSSGSPEGSLRVDEEGADLEGGWGWDYGDDEEEEEEEDGSEIMAGVLEVDDNTDLGNTPGQSTEELAEQENTDTETAEDRDQHQQLVDNRENAAASWLRSWGLPTLMGWVVAKMVKQATEHHHAEV